jgi:hypothetical protein
MREIVREPDGDDWNYSAVCLVHRTKSPPVPAEGPDPPATCPICLDMYQDWRDRFSLYARQKATNGQSGGE